MSDDSLQPFTVLAETGQIRRLKDAARMKGVTASALAREILAAGLPAAEREALAAGRELVEQAEDRTRAAAQSILDPRQSINRRV